MAPCITIEVKSGRYEYLIHQFFKTRIIAFMTYGQFLIISSSNLRFVFPDSRVRGLHGGARWRIRTLESQKTNLKPELLSVRN